MLRTCRIAAVLFLAQAAAASGQVQVIPTDSRALESPLAVNQPNAFDGPRLAGHGVLWAQRDREAIVIYAHDAGGRREVHRQHGYERDAVSYPQRFFSLDADATTVALSTYVRMCDPPEEGCMKYQREAPTRFTLHAGPLAGPLSPLPAGCILRVETGGGGSGGDCGAGFEVNEADGTRREYEGTESARFQGRLAGDVVALRRSPGFVVLRRSTGEELLRVGERVGAFDVAADGTVAYLLEGGRPAWSSPSDPAVHPLPGGPATDLVLAGDRVALRSMTGRFSRFTTVGLEDGRIRASFDSNATVAGFDYDGRRLAFVRRPCTRAEIRVWDSEGPPPPLELLTEGCELPWAEIGGRVGRDRIVRGMFGCDALGKGGCYAAVNATLRWRDRRGRLHRRTLGLPSLPLDEDERVRVRWRLSRSEVRRARSATILLLRVDADGDANVSRWPLRLPRGKR